MSDDGSPKSSFELAMERLRKKDAEEGITTRPMTDQQKSAIAEVRSLYDSKIAEQATTGIIVRRTGDGSYPMPSPPPDLGGTGAGQWRPTPPALAAFSAPWLGAVEPLLRRVPPSSSGCRQRESGRSGREQTSVA
jgi:hypothetical protein